MTTFIPSFKNITKVATNFTTNNPTMEDRVSQPVVIVSLKFNEITRSIEATCSDRRLRQVRIDRLPNDRAIQLLTKALQVAMDTKQEVQFIAAGGADPAVWFYNITGGK